jgi:hypothetical protein
MSQEMKDIELVPMFTGGVSTSFSHFAVLMQNCPYALGWVGWGDFNISSGAYKPTFGISSRLITNNKYKSHQDEYRMVMPHNVRSALKAAKTHLRPYTTLEIGHVIFDQFFPEYRKERERLADELRKFSGSMLNRQSVSNNTFEKTFKELRHLKQLGVTFATDVFDEAYRLLDGAEAALNELMTYKPCAHFVRIERGALPLVHVVVSTKRLVQDNEKFGTMVETFTYSPDSDPVPDWVEGRVATLQILEPKTYVPGVGYKYDNEHFFLEDNDERGSRQSSV